MSDEKLDIDLKKAMADAEAAIDKSADPTHARGIHRKKSYRFTGSGSSRLPTEDPLSKSEVATAVGDIVREAVESAIADERVAAGESLRIISSKLEASEAEVTAGKQELLRMMAEFENYKRRGEKEVDTRVHSVLGRLLEDFLPLGDNLSRAKLAVQGDLAILEGITMVEQAFYGALAKHDIAPVLSLGCSFDPAVHQAVAKEVTDQEPGLVVDEFEKGYTWRGRLMRPAKVVVSAAKEEAG